MRRNELDDQLRDPHLSVGAGIAIGEEIRAIDRQVRQIYWKR